MPLYWFHIDSPQQPRAVADQVRSIVRESRGWRENFRWDWWTEPSGPPFIGSVGDDSFKFHRDIRYRNSFLPVIRGSIVPFGMGSRVNVIMYLDPFVALPMMIILGVAASIVLRNPSARLNHSWLAFAIVAMTVAGFVPEAWKAKRILAATVLAPEEKRGE